MFALVLLSIVASAAASNVYADAECPDVKPMADFDLKAYATGRWYEIARYPNSIETGADCGWADYALDGDVFSVKNFDILKSKLRSIDGSAQLAEDAGNTGKLTFSYPYGVGGATTKSTLWVLGTDYNNFAVAYYCKYNAEKKSRQDFAWVLTRAKKLEGDAKSAVDKILSQNTFLDSSKLIYPNFSEDACTFEINL